MPAAMTRALLVLGATTVAACGVNDDYSGLVPKEIGLGKPLYFYRDFGRCTVQVFELSPKWSPPYDDELAELSRAIEPRRWNRSNWDAMEFGPWQVVDIYSTLEPQSLRKRHVVDALYCLDNAGRLNAALVEAMSTGELIWSFSTGVTIANIVGEPPEVTTS
jgi:hypothetical protein